MPKGKRHLKFRVGDLVRVKHGVADVDFPDIPMGGWVGRISKNGNGTHLVRWVIETLEQVHPIYRKRCERLGADYRKYWVRTDDLEPAPVEAVEVEQPTTIITRPLSVDNQEDRISMVFGLTSNDPLPDDSEATEMIYFRYLKTHLTFPFPARFFDPITSCKHEAAILGMCDDCPLEDGFGVVCDVLAQGEKEQMPLSELEVEPDDSNYQTVSDYLRWFVYSPEAYAPFGGDNLGPDLLKIRK
jgi:hypothetical protein